MVIRSEDSLHKSILLRHGRCAMIEFQTFQSMDKFPDTVDMFAYSVHPIYAINCRLSDCYNVLVDPKKKWIESRTFGGRCIRCTYRIVAMEWLEWINTRQWSWIANPLKCLPCCNKPNVVHCIDCVQKFDETFFVMWLSEPSGVIEKTERCSKNA